MLDYEKSNVLKTELYKVLESNASANKFFHKQQYYFFDDYKKLLWNDVTNILNDNKKIGDLDEFEKTDLLKNIYLLNNMDQLDQNNYILVRIVPRSDGEFIPFSVDATKEFLNVLKAL